MFHCVWVSAEMYSAPSIVLQSRGGDGSVHVFDDFRESYAWLRYNTKPDAKVRTQFFLFFKDWQSQQKLGFARDFIHLTNRPEYVWG